MHLVELYSNETFMLVIHSRDNKGLYLVHKITSPKNQPQFSQKKMRQYWLRKAEPKQSDPKFF